MKRIVLIIQALLSILVVNAQDFRNIEIYLSKIAIINSRIKTIDPQIQPIDSLLLNKEFKKDRDKYLRENESRKNTIRASQDTIIALQDTIITILNSKVKASEEQLEEYKNELKVKDFILCSDTTVFGSKFIELEIEKYSHHIRERYQLIYDLRSIDQKLTSIEEIVNRINTDEGIAHLSQKSKCTILQEETNDQILELREQLLKLNERDMSYLSEEQIKFFNEYLKPKYNNLIDVIYNDSINH